MTCESRSRTFSRFQSLLDSSSKIMVMLERPKRENGAEVGEMRNAVHLNFDGDGDLLLDFFGGAAGPLGDDLHVVVGDVRDRLRPGGCGKRSRPRRAEASASASTMKRLLSAESTRRGS